MFLGTSLVIDTTYQVVSFLMTHRHRRGVFSWLVALAAMACGTHVEAAPVSKVLILGSSVAGGESSLEALAVRSLGIPQVDVVTPGQWSAMTAEQFRSYRAIIIGAGECQHGERAFQAAIDNREVWGPVVDGNVVLLGAEVSTHGSLREVEGALEFVLSRSDLTGMYVALGCAYADAAPGTPVPLLEPFGSFQVAGVSCARSGHIFQVEPGGLSQALRERRLEGEACAARGVFTRYPEDTFAVVALAQRSAGEPLPGEQTCVDPWGEPEVEGGFVGTPYILVRGATGLSAGCRLAEPQPLAGNPPEARCQDVSVTADFTCGAAASIDMGSFDPDGDLVSCTQTPGGPYTLGTTTVTLTCTDAQGNADSCVGSVVVTDSEGPVLTVTGEPNPHLECGDQPDLGVQATDACYGTVPVTAFPSQVPRHAGEYDVMYMATDPEGNTSAPVFRHMTVTDTFGPELAMNSNFPTVSYFECTGFAIGNVWSNPGAIAVDACDGELQVFQFNTGDDDDDGMPGAIDSDDFGPGPDTQVEGIYTVRYLARDRAAHVQQLVLTVYVQDTMKPMLFLNGPESVQVQCFRSTGDNDQDPAPYVDAGVFVDDQCYGELFSPVFTFTTMNKEVPGVYIFEYQARDGAYNWADPLTRTVSVIDNNSPSITLNGANPLRLECTRGSYVDPDATAFDRCDGQIDPRIEVNATAVDSGTQGDYAVHYRVWDQSGNFALAERHVLVEDTLAPALRVQGGELTVACGQALPLDVVAMDACEGDLTAQVQRLGPDLSQPGTYPVQYRVSDSWGHTAVTEPRTVRVMERDALMVIPAAASSELTLECRVDSYDPSARAWDGCDTPLEVNSYNAGQDPYGPGPDTSVEGTSYVEHLAWNANWQPARSLQQVRVVDRTPPVLTLRGDAHVWHTCGSPWTDPGVDAGDACYGDLTASVVTTGEVNIEANGVYTLRYDVTDGAGLRAPTVERTVRIADCPE
jgi:hypothetical protein